MGRRQKRNQKSYQRIPCGEQLPLGKVVRKKSNPLVGGWGWLVLAKRAEGKGGGGDSRGKKKKKVQRKE